tara:strand:+ start:568 stop:1032 length:465 start_codon:yes stop_codon:yes gene_type:complete
MKKGHENSPNRWDFGKPEATADFITDLWGLKRWSNQRKAEKGDIIFDGCFYFLCQGHGICSILHDSCGGLIFRVPPRNFYQWVGSERVDKVDVEKILENTREIMSSQVERVMEDYGVGDVRELLPMGRKLITQEIRKTINQAVESCKKKIGVGG